MIYRFTFFFIGIFVLCQGFSQAPNLVPNGSFEQRTNCIWNNGDVEDAPPWFSPTAATPDVFHQCAVVNDDPCPWPESDPDSWAFGVPTNAIGCETPHTGLGYAGMFVYGPDYFDFNGYREYIGVRFIDPMIAGTDYTVKFYVSLSDRSGYSVWNLQVYFVQDSLTPMDTLSLVYNSYIDVDPQLSGEEGEFITDYDGWHEMVWDYTATGGEQFMYLGNFQRNSEIDTLYTLPFNPFFNDDSYSYYYIDDIEVREGASSLNDLNPSVSLSVYPNPALDKISIKSVRPLSKITLYDLQGRSMFEKKGLSNEYFQIDISNVSKGLYFLQVELLNEQLITQKIIKR